MSIADVTARISQIQQQLQTYVGAPTPAALSSTSTSATDFASALDSATGSSAAGRATSTTATASQQAVLDQAERYLGVPYQWGGTDPSSGLDCSGFVQLVYRNLGYDLPRVSGDQAKSGTAVAISGADGLDDAQPGDLLAFGSPVDHIAIYAGDGKMIEAPHTGANVRITDVWATPTAIRRVLPDQSTQSGAAAQLAAAQSAFMSAYNSAFGSNSTGNAGMDALLSSMGLSDGSQTQTSTSGSYGSYLASALGNL